MNQFSSDEFTTADLAAIEEKTQEIGQYFFAHLENKPTYVYQRRWWDDQIMQWSMRDELLKVELFRFVDVLPMLDTSEQVVQHLDEYLSQVRDRLPAAANMMLGVAKRTAFTRAAIARAAKLSARDFARRFIAGENINEVIDAARREREAGRAFTLDILGEAVISEPEAERFHEQYIRLIESVAPAVNDWPAVPAIDEGVLGPLPRMNLSIKLSALDSQFDPIDQRGAFERAGERFRTLLRVARKHGAFINVDMESYEKKDLTLSIFKSILLEDEFRDVGDVGIVIQCYLRDAERDLLSLRDWSMRRGKPVWVRLVKGAYWDYETVHAQAEGWPIPVFQKKWESDVNFERLSRILLRSFQHLRPAFGSHNLRSLAYACATADHLELPNKAFEIQMLYGMADAEKRAITDRGYRLRIYMPYGDLIPGMAYLVRRLLENTSNDSFVRVGLTEHAEHEKLLRNPADRSVDEETNTNTNGAPPMPVDPMDATFKNQPLPDFAEKENREAMTAALAQVREEFGGIYPLVIDGERIETEQQLGSTNPANTEEVVGVVALAEIDHAAQAVQAAKRALPAWAALEATQRAAVLERAAELMRERLFELSAWAVFECGKPWREATGDVCEAIDFCNYYAQQAVAMQQPQGADVPGEENRFVYQPRGVTAVIAPWNFPIAILTGMTTAALAVGNTVVMKPAEQSPVTAALVMEILEEAGAPPGVVNYLPGDGATVGAALVDNPDVALIVFTGSRQVGLSINARAAEICASGIPMVKRVIAEMGGKNAIIVDDDADLDEAVLGVAKSAFGFQGQKCSACSRAIVLDKVYDAFLERLISAAESMKVGPPEDPASKVGPLIDAESREKTLKYIELGKEAGRTVLAVDTSELAKQGHFVGPHIFADVSPEAQIAQEEIFAPVLAVIRAKDLDDAIAIANDTDYALTGGMFSRSPANLDRARRELQVGNLYLNRTITGALVGRQPFGGYKMSGIGSKAGGDDYLLQFVVPKTITENTMRRGFSPPE